jgi:hypothetical protein
MDNRIDPYIFKDDDGQLYMYMVRFTDGNTIWGRKMKNPSEFSGEPVFLFSSLPDTWETMEMARPRLLTNPEKSGGNRHRIQR